MILPILLTIFFIGCGNSSDTKKYEETKPKYKQTLKLQIGKTALKLEENTTIKVLTKNGKDVTEQVEKWLPEKSVKVVGHMLIPVKDGNITLRAVKGREISNPVTLVVIWEKDGHILPPEPDPKINNATLLGVDVNHNGVRDDVERWIYKKYDKYYPCHQELDYNNTVMLDGKLIPSAKIVCDKKPVPYPPAIRAAMMDVARAAQIIIQNPTKAKETIHLFRKTYYCAWAISKNLKDNKNEIVGKEFEYKQFNTAQRAKAYAMFNFYLSGGVYHSPSRKYVLKNWCSDKVKKLLQQR